MKNRIKNMSEFKYKVGDKVRIKSIDWYNENKDKDGDVPCGEYIFVPYMLVFCEKILTIDVDFEDGTYLMKEDNDGFVFTTEMIECKVEEECNCVTVDGMPNTIPIQYQTSSACFHNGFCGYSDSEGNETSEWNLPEGYQFVDEGDNVINATKIVLKKKKKEYPKTFLECCDVLNIGNLIERGVKGYKAELFDTLQKLLICRDAYWKIAGNELGLDKPWEPDWREERYIIYRNQDGIIGGYREAGCVEHHIFEFPTKEMRDQFKNNFNKELKICKELL